MSYKSRRQQLKSLMADNVHGASHICRNLINLFMNAANELKKSDYRKLVGLMSGWYPPMGNVLNVKAEIEASENGPAEHLVVDLNRVLGDLEFALGQTVKNAAALILKYDSIVTISNSGTIAECIKYAGNLGWKGTLYVGESRPALEGRNLVESLTKSHRGYKIIFGSDNEIMSRVPTAGAVFVGADLVSDSYFINKTGTAAMAALISDFRKMFVVADLSKYYKIPVKYIKIENHPACELWPKHPQKVDIVNRYFETVEYRPNMVFINEEGSWDRDAVKIYLENSDELE
jgi:translation initiation factor 2B subunit (eIF-2B alpha/beta/delta family)